jgi:hypothetical protein
MKQPETRKESGRMQQEGLLVRKALGLLLLAGACAAGCSGDMIAFFKLNDTSSRRVSNGRAAPAPKASVAKSTSKAAAKPNAGIALAMSSGEDSDFEAFSGDGK